MNQTPHFSKALAVAATLAFCMRAADAASLVNGNSGAGELFIGFRVGATPALNNVVIDVGAVATLAAASPGSVISLGNLGTDLTAQYGANWYERTDLTWGAAAGTSSSALNGDAANTLYGGVSATGLFPLSTSPYTRQGFTAQGGIAGLILSMASSSQGFTSAASGASSNIAIESTGDLNSWSSKVTGSSAFSDFTVPSGQQFEQAFGTGTLAGTGFEGALDVYRMYRTGLNDADAGGATSGPGSYKFTLAIDSAGLLTANVLPLTPVPEPASLGVLTSVALLGVAVLRRKRPAQT